MSTALSIVAHNTGASEEEIKEVLSGMIVSAKNQHGAKATNAELAIVSGVAAKYQLNPLVKEMAAFVSGGKLQVMVMIDGWYKMVNRQPEFDGVEFEDKFDGDKIVAVTCKMYLRNRSRPVSVTEYFEECNDPKSSVWKKWPARMLRHKAYIQAARMAFGISEVIDDDEAQRTQSNEPTERDITPENTPQKPVIDIKAVDDEMSKCDNLESLKEVSSRIRKDFEAMGVWDEYKSQIIKFNTKHKQRIENAKSNDIEEAEFEEVAQEQVRHEELANTKQSNDELDDIPFDDSEDEF